LETPKRLQDYISEYGRKYPGCWKGFESIRQGRGKDLPDWPTWCWCPLAAAYAVVSGGGPNRVAPAQAPDLGPLGALAAWRMTQGIYRFDPDIFKELKETPLDGTLPISVLYHLPEWCIYIESPPAILADQNIFGWFVHLEYDAQTGRPELRLVLDYQNAGLLPFPIHLTKSTLVECIDEMLKESRKQASGQKVFPLGLARINSETMLPIFEPLISVVLYLCTEAADIRDRKGLQIKPQNPKSTKVKGGLREFPAQGPTTWEVGYRLGAALKAAEQKEIREEQGSAHASPRPHIRRAHWHSFWTGPQDSPEKRKAVLKWLPPIPVNIDQGEIVPTVHKV
jgi:hypothetical protein